MTTPMAVRAVKQTALINMIAPTAVLFFIAARLTIHPLRRDRSMEEISKRYEGGEKKKGN